MSSLVHAIVPVSENVSLARDTYRLRLRVPSLAAAIKPGQFLMLRLPERSDPLLGRAFALYDVAEEAEVDIIYLVTGKMTRLMSGLRAGSVAEVWGPLGNGFPDYSAAEHLVLVAGGIGQTPFLSLAKRVLGQAGYGGGPPLGEVKRVSLFYGVRTAGLAAAVDDFRRARVNVQLASDDGSIGRRGFVTELLEERIIRGDLGSGCRLVGCGPEPMLKALAQLARHHDLECDLSLETPMACGVGVCFSCVTRIRTADGWDYRRVCYDGPVFDAASLAWDGS